MPRRVLLSLILAGVYGVIVLVVGLWPVHVDRGVDVVDSLPVRALIRYLSLTPSHGYEVVEVAANVIMFVPLGILAMVVSARSRWSYAVLLGLAISATIEIAQHLARPGRTASVQDVVANTSGAALGATIAVLAELALRRRRDARRPATHRD